MQSRRLGMLSAVALACLTVVVASAAATTSAPMVKGATLTAATDGCQLNSAKGQIKHVVEIQFDNTHFLRDNPNVPSDLEQMPHLLDFIRNNGTLGTNDHTILISHTAGGILSSLTGLYPDRTGQTVSNSYVRFTGTGGFQFPSSFGYWTDPASATTTIPNMTGPDGTTVPAPWVPFTRAGCNFGAVATANTVLENTGTGVSGDVTKVFGNPSPQFTEALASNAAPSGTAARAKAQTDFVGFAVHCAQGNTICASGQNDLLPDEAGGYTGFKGLFGAQEIDPLLTGQPASVPVTDLLGQPVVDPFNQPGFPGFDGMSAAVSLSYVAAMQEHGVPVTYAYISDAHDFHGVSGNAHTAFGPGSAGYVQQLKSYDDAFAAFFQRLQGDGITKSNTLFVFTVDEGDHFVGVTQTGCDGVNTPCNYGPNQIGELNANIDTLVSNQFPSLASQFLGAAAPNSFTVHGDDAPPFYLTHKAATGGGPFDQTDPLTRTFERDIAALTAVNAYTGNTDQLSVRMADQAGMKALHMITTGDPSRNAQFVLFADPNYFLTDFPSSTCLTCVNPAFAWNHGDIQPEIATTWIGYVGPGVRNLGDTNTWTDHADVRPTMLSLLGLSDDYSHDGVVVPNYLEDWAVPQSLRAHRAALLLLDTAYKQLDAPFGLFGTDILKASTAALKSGSDTSDSKYTSLESRISTLTAQRDDLAAQIQSVLDAAEFGGQALNERQAVSLSLQAGALLVRAALLSATS
jgi:hypothetical protein